MNDAHHVTFRFRMPPALAMRAPLGFWRRAPRGCTVDVDEQGDVLVTSVDRLETFARKQVLEIAGVFLRDVDRNVAPTRLTGTLSAPSCRERPEVYMISLGAAVSIARCDPRQPQVVTVAPAQQLDLINHAAG